MRWCVYIVRCADGTLYTGITTDIERRVIEHNTNNRRGSKYIRSRRPATLIYTEQYKTRSDASKREFIIKQLPVSGKIQLTPEYQKHPNYAAYSGHKSPSGQSSHS